MKFEVVNMMDKTVMNCSDKKYIPDSDTLSSMSKAGYKFKLDGKLINLKKAKELTNTDG